MLTICCSKWQASTEGKPRFTALHVNVLRASLGRHLHLPHELVCVTDDAAGLDSRIRVVRMPLDFAHTPRCRRRMQFLSREFCAENLGLRVLYLDLDVVIVDDITPLVDRTEPIVGWKVAHAGVYSGSFLLADAGALHGAWQRFARDPEGYPRRCQRAGVASDQAMLNDWLKTQPPIAEWTERDGLVTFFGTGYERHEARGVGPNRPELPAGARIVVLGSADLHVLGEGDRYPWVAEHYLPMTRGQYVDFGPGTAGLLHGTERIERASR